MNTSDRCDSCGAQAFVTYERIDGAELMFCGHHGNQYSTALGAQGFILTQQDNILPAPEELTPA